MRALTPVSGSGAKPVQDSISENHLKMPRLNLRTEVLLNPSALRQKVFAGLLIRMHISG